MEMAQSKKTKNKKIENLFIGINIVGSSETWYDKPMSTRENFFFIHWEQKICEKNRFSHLISLNIQYYSHTHTHT